MNIPRDTPTVATLRMILGRRPEVPRFLLLDLALMLACAWLLPATWRAPAALTSPDDPANLSHMMARLTPPLLFFLGIAAIFAEETAAPRRGFLLPASTARLVLLPMLGGSAAMLLGWLALATLVFPRFGDPVDPLVGGLALATALAWLQAIGWWPVRWPVLRVIALILGLVAACLPVAWLAIVRGLGRGSARWVFLLELAAAYPVALRGVALDRRGDSTGPSLGLARLRRLVGSPGGGGDRPAFRSASAAQFWFECRTKGPFVFGFGAFFGGFYSIFPWTMPWVFAGDPTGFLLALTTQLPIIGVTLGASFSRDDIRDRRPAGMSPFTATRPVSDAALARAKLLALTASLLAALAVAAASVPLVGLAVGGLGAALGRLVAIVAAEGLVRPALLAASGLVVAFALAWRTMLGGLAVALSDRRGLLVVAYFTGLFSLLMVVGLLSRRVRADPTVQAILASLAFVPPTLLALKLALAAYATRLASRRRRLDAPVLLAAGLAWLVIASAGIYLLATLFRPSGLAEWAAFASIAASLPPLSRLIVLPMAVAAARHR